MIFLQKVFSKINLKNIFLFIIISSSIVFISSSYFVINFLVKFPERNQIIVKELSKISQEKNQICGVIFGAKVYSNNNPSDALYDRLQTGIELYKNKVINCLVLSGGKSQNNAQHEVEVMKKIAQQNNIPTKNLYLDFAGKNSIKTLQNLSQKIDYFVLISNDFHLARLEVLAWKINLENYSTYSAKYNFGRYAKEGYFIFREIIAVIYYFFLPL